MPNAELTFADPNVSLSVREFTVEDGLSRLFAARVVAAGGCDLPLEAIAGQPAAFRLATSDPAQPYAVWSGLCADIELTDLEPSGASLYAVTIVPELWRTTQRRNSRIFQHQSAVEVALSLLSEWGIEPVLRLDAEAFPKREYRVQLDENDFAFLCRTLEEAGIGYLFEQGDPRGAEKNDGRELPSMSLVLTDRPAVTGSRRADPVKYVGNACDEGHVPSVRRVRLGRSVRPGRFTLSGYDYRSSPDLRLAAEVRAASAAEQAYEQFSFDPEAFLEEPRAGAPAPFGVAVREDLGGEAAALALQRAQTRQRAVSFSTNVLPLAPGVIFQLDAHPRADLAAPLLVTARSLQGEVDGAWSIEAEAAFAADPWRPARTTPKPRVMGVQSAMVVGPAGEEIFTDPLGRVKVQFHWDRYGRRDEDSSCWIRVSQAWAGNGFGVSHIPRVGSEVLVDFFDGDPDRPVIVGRAHNRGAMPPDTLPRDKTKSTWRSASSPGGDGYNEISMDDAAGAEVLHLRAQRDMKRVVLANDELSVGGNRSAVVQGDVNDEVAGNVTLEVAGDRKVTVEGKSVTTATGGVTSKSGPTTGLSYESGRLVLSNGQASIVLDGPNLYIDAGANLRVRSGQLLALFGADVEIDGNSKVKLDSDTYAPPVVAALEGGGTKGGQTLMPVTQGEMTFLSGTMEPEEPGGIEEAEFDGYHFLREMAAEQGLKLPSKLYFSPEVNEQIHRLGRIAYRGRKVRAKVLDRDTYRAMRTRLEDRIEAEKERIKGFGRDVHRIFNAQREHYGEVAVELRERLEIERVQLAVTRKELGAIFAGERGDLLASAKALVDVVKEQGSSLLQLRADIKAMVDSELETFKQFKAEWTGLYDEVKGYVDGIKQLIDDPKDAIMEIVFGEEKELANDITALADDLGYGDEVADFFGLESAEAAQEASKIGDLASLQEMEAAAEMGDAPPAYDPNEMQQLSGEGGWQPNNGGFSPPNEGGSPNANGLSKRGGLGEGGLRSGGLRNGSGLGNGGLGNGGLRNGGLGNGRGNGLGNRGLGGGGPSQGGLGQRGLRTGGLGGDGLRDGGLRSGSLGNGGRGLGNGASHSLGGGGTGAAPGLGSNASLPGGGAPALSHGLGSPAGVAGGPGLAPGGAGMSSAAMAGGPQGALADAGAAGVAKSVGQAGQGTATAARTGHQVASAHGDDGKLASEGGASAADTPAQPDGSRVMGRDVPGAEADAISQPGALSATEVAAGVSDQTSVLLQSPSDGQILVVPSAGAERVDRAALSAAMVEAQMEGAAAKQGMAEALADRGYTVYTRPWGDWKGPFVQIASA